MREIRLPMNILKITAAATLVGGSISDTRQSIEYDEYSNLTHTTLLLEGIEMNLDRVIPYQNVFVPEPFIGPQKPSDEYLLQIALEELERGVAKAVEEEKIRKEEEERIALLPPPQNESVSAASVPPAPVYEEGETVWDKLVVCEASGNWAANTGNGFEGGLQFLPSTWLEYKDPEMPVHAYDATREQQITVAERVLLAQGWDAAWPGCSAKLGIR